MFTRIAARMMGPNLSAPPHCRCCNEQHRHRGAQRARERAEWRRDAHRGEVDRLPHLTTAW